MTGHLLCKSENDFEQKMEQRETEAQANPDTKQLLLTDFLVLTTRRKNKVSGLAVASKPQGVQRLQLMMGTPKTMSKALAAQRETNGSVCMRAHLLKRAFHNEWHQELASLFPGYRANHKQSFATVSLILFFQCFHQCLDDTNLLHPSTKTLLPKPLVLRTQMLHLES